MTRFRPFVSGEALLAAALAVGATSACTGPSEPTAAEKGDALRNAKGCANCHSVDGSGSVGPTWKGLYGSEVELSDGSKVRADDGYLAESMLQPSKKTVKGFQEGLMETVIKPNSLSRADVAALIAYIKTLD